MLRPLLISALLTSTALAETWTVDDDGKANFDNIQAAVDAAVDGDEIIVMPGTYTSTQDGHVVNMLGKAVTLRSSDPTDPDVVAATIIDGELQRGGLQCDSGESAKTVFEGFHITNCNGGYLKGGITLENSGPRIRNCIVDNNSNSSNGSGIICKNSDAIITDCRITNNMNMEYSYPGGGLAVVPISDEYISETAFPTIKNTIFCGNYPNAILGKWIDGGGNCIAFLCDDKDGDSFPDECQGTDDGVHHVPDEYQTIQEAINAASDFEEIIVHPGTYYDEATLPGLEDTFLVSVFNPGGKRLWIHSSDGPSETIINFNNSNYTLATWMYSGENADCIIEGFTFKHIDDSISGLATKTFLTSPTFKNCVFDGASTGLEIRGLGPEITDCDFVNNSTPIKFSDYPCSSNIIECNFMNNSYSNFGLINIGNISSFPPHYSEIKILSSIFMQNTHNTNGNYGAIILNELPTQTRLMIDDCIFEDNIGPAVIRFNSYEVGSVTINNSTINNHADAIGLDLSFVTGTKVEINNCTIENNAIGISIDYFNDTLISNSTVCNNTKEQISGEWIDGGGNTICLGSECPDINGDSEINIIELLTVIDQWGETDSSGDVNQDGIVDVGDVLLVVGNWGPCIQ